MTTTADRDELISDAVDGDRRSLARLITLAENGREEGTEVLRSLFPSTGRAHVVGVTGAPGAGKSTLTDGLISRVRGDGRSIAVLAIDPSSPYSGGAILGDRIRMQDHISDGDVYIRSMASRGHLGGLSAATPKAIAILDAVGFPFIIVETVGVGQAEVDIVERADTTVVVVNPRWGDTIQAAKAGLLEIGDVFVVNKADRPGVDETVRDLNQMINFDDKRPWRPKVVTTVATDGEGIDEVWDAVLDHRRHLIDSGRLDTERARSLVAELTTAIAGRLLERARTEAREAYATLEADVLGRRLDPWTAAQRLIDDA